MASSLKETIKRFKRGPADVVGIDIGVTGTKVVRMHKGESGHTLVAADIVPVVPLPESTEGDEDAVMPAPMKLPPRLKAKYASLAASSPQTIVKLLNLPGHFDSRAEERVVQGMGLDDPDDYRVSYKLIAEGHGRAESRVLTVAMPELQAAAMAGLLPTGIPAPLSVEVSGLAAMTAILNATNDASHEAVAVIDFGAALTTFAIFNKGVLSLVRRFNVGGRDVLAKVRQSLGVDEETALGIVTDGSFDISQAVSDVVSPLIKQILVSRDYVERRENCRLTALYVSGGLGTSRDLQEELKSATEVNVQLVNPFQQLKAAKDAVPDYLAGQEWRLAAAVGACIGTFEET